MREWLDAYIKNEVLRGQPLKTTADKVLKKDDFNTIQ